MKKTLLLCAAALSYGLAANAQTAQDIPNETPLNLTGDYVNIQINHTLEEGEVAGSAVTHEKYKNGEAYYFSNFKSDDVAELCVKSAKESCYIIHFEVAAKNDNPGSYGEFELKDKTTGDVVWSVTNYFDATAKAWYGLGEYELYVNDPIPAGEYIFSIVFQNENGGKTNTFNIGEFKFEARESIDSYGLYTYVEPGDEAGAIVLSPSRNYYLADSEVVATATAKNGYRFNHFENGYGDVITENPYTLVMTERTELIAYFDELKMFSDIPGYVDLYTGNSGQGNAEDKAVKLDGESYNEGNITHYLANYRHSNYDYFEINVTEAGEYTMWVPTSSKQEEPTINFTIYNCSKETYEANPSEALVEWTYKLSAQNTGNWQQFVTNEIKNINLTAGRKVLKLDFTEPVATKYTANILYMAFGLNGELPEPGTDGIEDVIAGENAPVKAYNLQGIEVEPTAKGLIILSNGTKVYNK